MQTGRTTQFGNNEPAAMRRLTSKEVKWNAEMIEANGCGNQPTTRTECQTRSRWQSKMQRWLVQLPLVLAANAVSASLFQPFMQHVCVCNARPIAQGPAAQELDLLQHGPLLHEPRAAKGDIARCCPKLAPAVRARHCSYIASSPLL